MVPTTLAAFLGFCGAPTRPLEACSICKVIPDHCREFEKEGDPASGDIPWDAVRRLVPLIDEIKNSAGVIQRCPECGRIYSYQRDYDPMPSAMWSDYDAETTHSYRRRDPEELFRAPWFTCLRILRDERFPGHQMIVVDPQAFFGRHVFAQVGHHRAQWVVLFDEHPLEVVGGRLEILARVVAGEPVEGLGERDRLIEYATFADRVTTEYPGGFSYVDAFDAIPWRRELASEELAQIEDLRAASRVAPLHVDQQADAYVIRRWVVAAQRLICRLLTVLPSGELRRDDAVVGESIPIDPNALAKAR